MSDRPWPFSLKVDAVARGRRLRLFSGRAPLRQDAYLHLLASDPAFTRWYSRQLLSQGGEAFFWEHPPMSHQSAARAVELVLIEAPALASARADGAPFAEHFAAAGDEPVCTFRSLGGDATLIAPCPSPAVDATHLGAFLRSASDSRQDALWAATGQAMEAALNKPHAAWLSTSGLGVYWLHVRIDQRPKYYQHLPYRGTAE